MNKFIISSLHGITLLGLIFYCVFILIQIVITVFDLPHNYITSQSKGGGSYITLGLDGNIIPVQLQIRVLNDTIVRYKKKGDNNINDFPLHEKGIIKNGIYEEIRKDVIKHRNEMELDTIVGMMIPHFPEKHPYMEGFRHKEERRTGKKIDHLYSHSYPVDTFVTNPIITFKDVKTTYANIEVKASYKRDRILLSIPEWINRILTLLLIFQLFKVLGNVIENIVFDIKNVKRIRFIGFIMIGFFLEPFFSNYLYQTFIISGFHDNLLHIPSVNYRDYQNININFNVREEFKPTNLYVGLITLILATIFKRGLALQQEQDLTV
jgi:Protein of unknown function (DUF2975)